MGDDFQSIDHVTSKFERVALEGSKLELELSFELSPNGAESCNQEYNPKDVFWYFYSVRVRSPDNSIDVEAEFGRTLYDKNTYQPHKWHSEGDDEVASNLCRFLGYLSKRSAKGSIVSDESTLFDDMGTLEGKDFLEAVQVILCAKKYASVLRREDGSRSVRSVPYAFEN